MSAYASYARQAQEQLFAGLSQLATAQEQILNAAKEGRPVIAELPTPVEFIENSFGFAARALDFQKEYALRWANLLAPKAPAAL
ncbi:MAG: hypothetical protein JOZ39_10065 [Chloroflexi bacterium]|nr:hypothetical protein [Chloroflexota bacterium]